MAMPIGKKRQKIDHEIEIRLQSSQIDAEAKIIARLRDRVIRGVSKRWRIDPSRPSPTLYNRYRGDGFPLRENDGKKLTPKKLPPWRSLSSWMKLQVATLALADSHYMQFTVHLHDDLAADLVAKGQDVRRYLLNRLTRRLRNAFQDQPPGFLFVVEDRDQDGAPVRIHAHGSIAVPRLPVDTAPNRKQAGLRKLIANGRQREAELIAGRMFLRRELAAAAGINSKRPMIAATGRSQSRNVWTRTPMFVTITDKWVNYAFKNVHRFSPELGEDRDAISTALKAQARDVWEVIRNGDAAVMKILGRP